MILDDRRTKLAVLFDILRMRYRANVTFRKWVILSASLHDDWDDVRDGMAPTQPIRIDTFRDAGRASSPTH